MGAWARVLVLVLLVLVLVCATPTGRPVAVDHPAAMVDELLRAARARHPDDCGLRRASRAIRGVQLADDDPDMVNWERMTVRRGRFDRERGVLHVTTRRPDGRPLHPGIVRGVIVHEVAHAAQADGKHSDAWRGTYVRLLRVATEDLGWPVALECSACRYYGVCARDDCPACARVRCRTRVS